jgi:(2R)-3-sulfolactate dehydrogenase (NADP+)
VSFDQITLSIAEASALATAALMANDTSRTNAESVARSLVLAEADGQAGHGLSRVASYALQSKAKKIDGHARPEITHTASSALRVDARSGFAYPALDLAIEKLSPLARSHGLASAALFHSHHFGQAGQHVERLAQEGLVALAFSNTPRAMAPLGSSRSMMGTNPIAFAAPLPSRAPLVIDLALSVVARSRIVAAHNAGKSIPSDWAVDAAGQPTTDPAAALQGSLLPIGGAKGAALALMVEVLCGALAGAAFGWEASSFLDDKGGPPNVGQVLLAIDPQDYAGESFLPRMQMLVSEIESSGARLPGDRRLALRQRAQESGLTISSQLHREMQALAS